MHRLDSGNHQQIIIHLQPIEVIARIANKMCQDGPLGPAVSLSERMQIAGCAIEVHDLLHKLIVGKSFKIVLFFEAAKNQISLTLNILNRAEIRPFLLIFAVRICPAQSYKSEKRKWWMAL